MEKWKIAAIVALLAALPAYSYFQNPPTTSPNSDGGSDATRKEAEKPVSEPPAYLQKWWGKKPLPFSYSKDLWANTKKPLTLDDFKGNVILLELWRANCPHCQDAAPYMEQYAQNLYSSGLRTIGVHSSADHGPESIEYNWKAVQQKMKEMGVGYPVAFDEKRELFNKYGAQKFPTFIIIDRKGIIRYAHEGMTEKLRPELEAALRQVLAGKTPAWPPTRIEGSEDAASKYAPDKS